MPKLFHLRGYYSHDRLDDLTGTQRTILTSIVGLALGAAFLYCEFVVFHVTEVQWSWTVWSAVPLIILAFVLAVTSFRKSSSLLPIAMMLAVVVPVEFFLQAHYNGIGKTILWVYREDGFLWPLPQLVRLIVGCTLEAFVVGCGTLWISRILAPILFRRPAPVLATEEQYANLFTTEWTNEDVAKPKRDFAFVALRAIGLMYVIYLVLMVLGAVGSSSYPAGLRMLVRMTYENTPLAINTYFMLVLMASLAMIGAYNKELRYHTSIALLAGHVVSIVASLFFYYTDAASMPYHNFLLVSAIADTFLALIFLYVIIANKDEANLYKIQKQYPEFYSVPNRLTVIFFYLFGVVATGVVAAVVVLRLIQDGSHGWGALFGFPDPQICNTLMKFGTLAVLAFMVARREPLRNKLYPVFVATYAVSLVASMLLLVVGGMFHPIDIATRGGGHTTLDWYFMFDVGMSGLMIGLLLGLRKMYYNIDYSIIALSPAAAQNVMGFHGALHGDDPEFDGLALQSVDRMAANIRGRKRGLLNMPFALVELLPTVLALRSPFSAMGIEDRRWFLRYRLLRQPTEQKRAFIPELADLLFKIGNACHALVTLSHYTHIRSRSETGFVPADARDRLQGELPAGPPPFANIEPQASNPLDSHNYRPDTPAGAKLVAPRMVTAISETPIPAEVDYLIIGSGAGGAVMAYRLACGAPDAKILVVERGPRYSPIEDFNDNEMEMVCKLYKEGGLQQTKRFDLMILQGECVGGTTVINNAVTFPMPDPIKSKWQNEFDIDLSTLQSNYDAVAKEINITEISQLAINQKVAKAFRDGITGYNAETGSTLQAENLSANHLNMAGDGLDNIGNKHMRKRSMLETYLPWAEARGVQILPETSAVRFSADGRRAEAVLLRTDLGHTQWVKVRKAVVVSGGVLASSDFLLRSGVTKNVGERLACNFALPIAFEFEQELKAYDGVQITVGALDPNNRAIFETYFNPPGAFSISLPFYFDEHARIMQQYSHCLNLGALVGSEPNGRIDHGADILNGRAFTWELGETDLANIKYAISSLARIGKNAGAIHGAMPFEPGISLHLQNPGELDRFTKALDDYPITMADLRLTTAHPQGGNGMAGDKSSHRDGRVIDTKFRVDGYDNLFVADASVFPTGITVNPQWTIMALSSMASEHVLDYSPSAGRAFSPRTIYPTVAMPWLFKKRTMNA